MIRVETRAFDPSRELAAFIAGRTDAGALVSFVGLCRGEGGAVETLTLDYYPGFTEDAIAEIAQQARARFDVIDVLVIHRAGVIAPGEPIVLAAALSAHRKQALAAVDFLMDYLKTDAPFWKREAGPSGARWIEPTGEDYAARAAWKDKT